MKRKNRILLASLGLATAGIAAGAIGGVLSSNIYTTAQTDTNNTGSKQPTQTIVTQSARDAFAVRMTKSEDVTGKFVLTVKDNNKKEGAIYIVGQDGEKANQLLVAPGDTVQVGVTFNKGYDNYTLRDLKIFGVNPNWTVPTKQNSLDKSLFEFTLPTVEEQQVEGENMFYGNDGSEISMIPTFIVSSIGENTNWEHGAFNGDLNGYVHELNADTTWSQLVKEISAKQFENVDKNYPIDVYVYLNGHTLTVDDGVELPVSQKGWSVNFYNYKNNKGARANGKIVPANGKEVVMAVDGTVSFGYDVDYSYIPWGNGIKFVDKSSGWVGVISNETVNK